MVDVNNGLVGIVCEDLGELLGKGFEVKVVSMSGGKTWDVRRHLGKWTMEKMDCVVVHVGTNHIQRGTGMFNFGRNIQDQL